MSDRLFEPPDRGAAEHQEHQEHLDELAAAEAELDGVEIALRRLDDGSYGTCEVCGVALPEADVEAEPTARRCPAHRLTP